MLSLEPALELICGSLRIDSAEHYLAHSSSNHLPLRRCSWFVSVVDCFEMVSPLPVFVAVAAPPPQRVAGLGKAGLGSKWFGLWSG